MRRLWLSLFLIVGLLVAGCTANGTRLDPGPKADTPERAASELAAGLSKKNLKAVEFAGASGADVDLLFQPLVAGMGPLHPEVSIGAVTAQGNGATADLAITWAFAGIGEKWSYQTQARLTADAGRWKTAWQPGILQPQLNGANRLSQRRLRPERGRLLGEDGRPIVTKRAVYRIGIDKAAIGPDRVKSSARRLAKLVKIGASRYAARVAAAGKEAFVEAIVLRTSDKDLPLASDIRAIPGGTSIQDDLMLAPYRDFARPVIGVVADATKEIVDASGGTVVGGDQVGVSGLQKRYDSLLRGTPGVRVQLVAVKNSGSSASPSPTPSPTAAAEPVTVFEVPPVPGKPLSTTLQVTLQKLAEKTLAKTRPAAAIVAVRPSTGAVLVAANNSATNGQSLATVGRNPPGSTFKVITSLALLRAGLTPDSRVTCPRTVDVNGKKFTNYSDYPSSHLGSINLRTALAQSCNTAFIGQRGKLKGSALADAAGSLGLGIDYDVGFPSFFGSVPEDSSATGRAAALIGQGKVEASPMAMAAVVASVAAGRTVIPQLIKDQQADSKARPLTRDEAAQLRAMMRGVVTQGSGRVLGDLGGGPVIAKTGTAEYGRSTPYKTHAWMIAAQDDLAVAVFVNDGQSGSRTAGPLLRSFLDGAF